jgi:DNA-binding transcriptional LysR family regulator
MPINRKSEYIDMNDFEDRNMGRSSDLQLPWLRAFVHAVDAGSLAAAGALLHRSPASMSMQLKKLEDAVSEPLLARNARGLALTPRAHREAQEAVSGPALAGTVRLGIPEDYAGAYLAPVLRGFGALHPGVDITLVCAQSTSLIPQARAGDIDVALVTQDRAGRGELLFHEPLVWVGSAGAQAWRRDPLPVAVFEEGSNARSVAERALRKAGRRCRIAYSSPSNIGQVAAVESGLAVAALARCSVPPGLLVLDGRHGMPGLPALPVAALMGSQARQSPAALSLHGMLVAQLRRPAASSG